MMACEVDRVGQLVRQYVRVTFRLSITKNVSLSDDRIIIVQEQPREMIFRLKSVVSVAACCKQ